MLNTNNRKIGDRVETLKFISRCEATKRSTEVCLEVGKWREREREGERGGGVPFINASACASGMGGSARSMQRRVCSQNPF